MIAVRGADAGTPDLPAPLAARGARLREAHELRALLDEVAFERAG